MVLLGGGGTLWGPILGAVAISVLFELLQPLGQALMAMYGLIIMGIMLFMPRGIVGGMKSLYEGSAERRFKTETEALDTIQIVEMPTESEKTNAAS
jgi:branched-chain amino acid transport system permease protein